MLACQICLEDRMHPDDSIQGKYAHWHCVQMSFALNTILSVSVTEVAVNNVFSQVKNGDQGLHILQYRGWATAFKKPNLPECTCECLLEWSSAQFEHHRSSQKGMLNMKRSCRIGPMGPTVTIWTLSESLFFCVCLCVWDECMLQVLEAAQLIWNLPRKP